MWTMPCNIESVRSEHPEWYMVNRLGESAAEKPAYVDYYRFLCPSRPEVSRFLAQTVEELAVIEHLDGVHLDYIRYPDVILPEALQPRYGISQKSEEAAYDYCYCEVCCSDFERETGIDIMRVDDPSACREWIQFRHRTITDLVNNVFMPIVHRNGRSVTAAVFPAWELVRQNWPAWNLDGALPMLYHTLYRKNTDWIREQTMKGVASLSGGTPLYSGLLVSGLSPDELADAIRAAQEGGANGIALFPAQAMTVSHWEIFRKAIAD
jgi:uncharacterized lipoprotein YddW (UPF0748 family)